MKAPDVKFNVGVVTPFATCRPVVGSTKYRISHFRRASLVVKDVDEAEARAFCKRHKIDFPAPPQEPWLD